MPDTRDHETMLDDAKGVSMDALEAENKRLREALSTIERARPHHYQMFFEDHAAFVQRLKALARAALSIQPVT